MSVDPSQDVIQATLSRLPRNKRDLFLNQLNSINTRLTALQAQYDQLLASAVESYTFAGGEGSQSAKRRSMDQVSKQIEFWTARYNYLWDKLYGYGNVNMALRRR